MISYDTWLESRYQQSQEMPPEVEDYMGLKIFVAEEDATGEVVDYEVWEDEDEDGKHGGFTLVVEFPASYRVSMRPDEVDAYRDRQAKA